MKKTLVALLALAGVAVGADYTVEHVWTMDFGNQYTDGYNITGTLENKGTVWDVATHVTEDGVTTASDHRVHLENGLYGSWDEDFQFSITLTLGDPISASNAWPVFAEISGNNTALRFGPYTDMSNSVALDGDLTKASGNLVSVEAGGTYTITLTKIGNEMTLAVDGVVTSTGTLSDTVTGNITDINLGGNKGSDYRINETVQSISWSRIIPEPTTATLSLLALAGLAARRRRK